MHKSAIILFFIAILLGGVILSTVLVAEPTTESKPISTLTLKEKLFWAMRSETPLHAIIQVLEESAPTGVIHGVT